MKALLFILLTGFFACTARHGSEHDAHAAEAVAVRQMQINSGDTTKKWKADEATKRNVAVMMKIVEDTSYKDAANRTQLASNLQAAIDNLIKECRMKGPDHDALHHWLEKVLEDIKALKADEHKYKQIYAALNQDVMAFYKSFE